MNDTLSDEVREALDALYGFAAAEPIGTPADWDAFGLAAQNGCRVINAELLRLQSTESRANEWQLRAERAEAELAALKARIAEAQECGVVALCGGGASLSHEPYPSLVGKRVRLVVDEPAERVEG